jgi:hypothetical protein
MSPIWEDADQGYSTGLNVINTALAFAKHDSVNTHMATVVQPEHLVSPALQVHRNPYYVKYGINPTNWLDCSVLNMHGLITCKAPRWLLS